MNFGMIKVFWPQIQSTLLGWARNGLSLGAGILVTDGYMTKDQTQDFIGAGFFFVALLLHVFDVVVVNHKVQKALYTPVPPGPVPPSAQTPPSAGATMAPIPNPIEGV